MKNEKLDFLRNLPEGTYIIHPKSPFRIIYQQTNRPHRTTMRALLAESDIYCHLCVPSINQEFLTFKVNFFNVERSIVLDITGSVSDWKEVRLKDIFKDVDNPLIYLKIDIQTDKLRQFNVTPYDYEKMNNPNMDVDIAMEELF